MFILFNLFVLGRPFYGKKFPPAAPSPGGWGSAAPRGRSGPGPCWTAARGPGEKEYLAFNSIW